MRVLRAMAALSLLLVPCFAVAEVGADLHGVKRVYVDRLTGDEAAAQMRDLIITSLHNSKLFVITENPERADAELRGAAEDIVFTDQFAASDNVDLRAGASKGSRGAKIGGARSMSVSVGDSESVNIHERKHEAMATVRLVNKQGDVIWSTTQESTGAKFKGASADVADKITRQLVDDYQKVGKPDTR